MSHIHITKSIKLGSFSSKPTALNTKFTVHYDAIKYHMNTIQLSLKSIKLCCHLIEYCSLVFVIFYASGANFHWFLRSISYGCVLLLQCCTRARCAAVRTGSWRRAVAGRGSCRVQVYSTTGSPAVQSASSAHIT